MTTVYRRFPAICIFSLQTNIHMYVCFPEPIEILLPKFELIQLITPEYREVCDLLTVLKNWNVKVFNNVKKQFMFI